MGNGDSRAENAIDVLVVTGNRIIPRKLESKLAPLLASDWVKKVYLVTNGKYPNPKVRTFIRTEKSFHSPFLVHVRKAIAVLGILIRYSPAVVITVGLIPHGIYTIILASFFKRKKVYLSMGMNERIYSETGHLDRLLRRIAFLSDWIGTRGTHSKAQLVRHGFKADRIFIPHNVFDFDDFKPVVCEKIYDLIYVGLLEPYKRIDLLIEAVRRLVEEKGLKEIRLAIVGGGSLKDELQHQSRALGLQDHVCFLPPGDAQYVCRMLNQSKIFVMTSQREGLPMAIIEAMSCGLPVVAFEHADIGDVAEHGKNSLLCAIGDVECFAASVEQLLKNKQVYEALSRSALRIRVRKRDEYSLVFLQESWRAVLASI